MIAIIRDRVRGRTEQQLEFAFERRLGLLDRLRLFILRRRADAMLRRTLRPFRTGSAAQLTPHLLKDIGLPPDFRM